MSGCHAGSTSPCEFPTIWGQTMNTFLDREVQGYTDCLHC